MPAPHPEAERIRVWAFQPLADAMDARLGINCFDAAAALLVANALGDVAYQTHLVASGDAAAHGSTVLLLHLCLWVSDASMARGLSAFSRNVRDRACGRFHPRHRGGTWLGLSVAVALGVDAASDLLTGCVAWSAWTTFGYAYCAAFPVALFLAACEWRRPPPSRSRRMAHSWGAA